MFNLTSSGGWGTWSTLLGHRVPIASVFRIRAVHWTGAGQVAPHWSPSGTENAGSSKAPYCMTASGPGRAFIAWTDAGADAGALYAQFLADDAAWVRVGEALAAGEVRTARATHLN